MNTQNNDLFRSFIMNSMILDNTYSDAELDDGTRCYLCSEKIKKLALFNHELLDGMYDSLISIIYLDAYKILNLKEKELSITYLEQDTLNSLKNLTNFSDLKQAIEDDKFLLEDMLGYFLEYYRMNEFRKLIAYKAISPAYKYMFEDEYVLFKQEAKEIDKKLNLDMIIDIAKKQLELIEEVTDKSESYENVLTKLEGFFSNLNRDDTFLFIGLFRQIIELDYKWIKYITDKGFRCDWLIEEDLEYRMDKYEEYDLDELVTEAICDPDYYEQLLDSFLSIKCDNMGMSEKLINEELVDSYYKKHVKNRVRE